MKRCIAVSTLCLLLAGWLTVLMCRHFGPTPESLPTGEGVGVPTAVTAAPIRLDSLQTVTLLRDGEPAALTLEEYLPGVVAGEMPASFEPEALRAQAIAARTYALYKHRQGGAAHPGADVCADPGCCQVWLDEGALRERWGADYDRCAGLIRAAVEDTDGVVLTYEGEPILACFHASSAGTTESSAALWGTALPYLVSVESPETAADVPNFVTTVEISPEELRSAVETLAPGTDLSSAPALWPGECVRDDGGRVKVQVIGGTAVSGEALRQRFALRSASFTLTWTGQSFLFTVTGSGHGAGMSQYGANVMARQGSSWAEILAHYYPGTQLARLG